MSSRIIPLLRPLWDADIERVYIGIHVDPSPLDSVLVFPVEGSLVPFKPSLLRLVADVEDFRNQGQELEIWF